MRTLQRCCSRFALACTLLISNSALPAAQAGTGAEPFASYRLAAPTALGTSSVAARGVLPAAVPVDPSLACAWSDVASPNTGSPNNYFHGVAALAPDDVWAVGGYGIAGFSAWQLVQHWDGSKWSLVAPPPVATPSELLAISAVHAADIWAVGGGNTGGGALTEHWDGSSWSVVPCPSPGTFNRLFGVAAIASDNVWAVGQYNDGGLARTLVLHWNGSSWSVIPSPNVPGQHNQLNAVAAVPGAPNEVWAVGTAGASGIAMRWNGAQWSLVATPPAGINAQLTGVTAIAPNDVWAVGWAGTTSGTIALIEHWNGSTWSVVPSPSPSSTYNYLWGVTALGPNAVWAVGDFNATGGHGQTLILRWNGATWTQEPGDHPGPIGLGFSLKAVSAISGSDVWSVGTNSHALAEHWDGSKWSKAIAPNAGIGENELNAVSGRAANDVWSAGYYRFGTEQRTLIQHWNGGAWRIFRSPNTNKRLNVLGGVVAISPTAAWAVGSATSGGALDQTTLILGWNGTSWSIVPSPSPGTLGLNELHAVAASAANDVWAVGNYTHIGEYAQTLIEHWNGSSWQVVPSANHPGTNNGLFGVVALAPDDVWAVGYSGVAEFETLIQHWNGSTWTIVPSPTPAGSSSILRAVSATGPNDIWAVGTQKNLSTSMTSMLIEHWNGSAWSLVGAFAGSFSGLYGVAAVSPTDAWAVADSGGLAVIERWNGSLWSMTQQPDVTGRLHAASAITSSDAWAVGLRYEEGTGFLTLSERLSCD